MPKRDLVRNFAALDASNPYDVCIIGSGPAGATLGTRLVEYGLRTIVLESGNSLLDWFVDPRLRQLAEYEFTGDTQYPLTRTAARVVGGNANFWTGRCERFHPSDFERHPFTPPDNPWPIKYDELEPYYVKAERTLRVRGANLSKFTPPRSADLPVGPRPKIDNLKKLMAKAGVVIDDSATATPTKAIRFFRFHKEVLPAFFASPHGTLVSGVTVTRLLHDEHNRVVGALAKTLNGETKVARAKIYIVACGGIQTPRLLLLSRSERFPQGIGNEFDRVGRGFNEHPGPNIYSKIRHNRCTMDPRHKIGRTHQFYDYFRSEGLGAVLPVIIQSWWFPNHLLHYRLVDMPKHVFKIARRAMQPTLYISAITEMKPVDENRVTLSETKQDLLGDPAAHLIFNYSDVDLLLLDRLRELFHTWFDKLGATNREEIEVTWSRHHIGTCRMGDNPKTSVVDANQRVHTCSNLYLGGSEVFVTGSSMQPVLTIVALAHRLADHLINRFAQGNVDQHPRR